MGKPLPKTFKAVEAIIIFSILLLVLVLVGWIYPKLLINHIRSRILQKQQELVQFRSLIENEERTQREIQHIWSPAFQSFCAVDCETTGLSFARSRVIQICLMLYTNGVATGRRVWWIDPGVKIPRNATKVNRITTNQVRGKGSFMDHSLQIKMLLERYPLVGHNLRFDIQMIRAEFQKLDSTLNIKPLYCTMRERWGAAALQDDRAESNSCRPRWKKLSMLADELGVVPAGELHDAEVDARLCGDCFVALAKKSIACAQSRLDESRLKINHLTSEINQMLAEIESVRERFSFDARGKR